MNTQSNEINRDVKRDVRVEDLPLKNDPKAGSGLIFLNTVNHRTLMAANTDPKGGGGYLKCGDIKGESTGASFWPRQSDEVIVVFSTDRE